MSSFVYVFAADDGTCKVGISQNPLIRKADIERDKSRPLILFAVYPCDRNSRLEPEAHATLASFALSHEWFACSPLQAAVGVEVTAERLGIATEAHQLEFARGDCSFTFRPAVEGVEEPSVANLALWCLAKHAIQPVLRWPAPALPYGPATADMVQRARAAGIEVREVGALPCGGSS